MPGFENLPMRDRIAHELTQLDARKHVKDRHWNRYFIGLALQALDRWQDDVDAGMSEARAFAENFTPAREMHTIARRLQLGLDVDHGSWVLPDGTRV